MVWPARVFDEGESAPGTRGRLGVLSVLSQGHGTLVELTGLLNADWGRSRQSLPMLPLSLRAVGLTAHVFPPVCPDDCPQPSLQRRGSPQYDLGWWTGPYHPEQFRGTVPRVRLDQTAQTACAALAILKP